MVAEETVAGTAVAAKVAARVGVATVGVMAEGAKVVETVVEMVAVMAVVD